jgi:hypothetical protein
MRAAIGASSHSSCRPNGPEKPAVEDHAGSPELASGPGLPIPAERVVPSEFVDEVTSTTELRQHVARLGVSAVRPDPEYMASMQPNLNWKMREILIDWLGEVQLKFKLKPETLFQAVHLLDCTLSRRCATTATLQLVGCAALLIASKFEEIYPPEISEFIGVSDRAYTRATLLAMERTIVCELKFHLDCVSPFQLMELMAPRLAVAVNASDEWHLSHFYLQATLQKQLVLRLGPVTAAAAALFLARCSLRARASLPATLPLRADGLPESVWTTDQHDHIGVTRGDLALPVQQMREAMKLQLDKTACKCRGVNKKFLNPKFDAVASLPVW